MKKRKAASAASQGSTSTAPAVMTGEQSISPEERHEILKARAAALAREPEDAGMASEQLEIIEFLLSAERYGIESKSIGEVYPLRDLTPLPCTPSFVLGIMNIRGRILPVLDIRKFFDLPEKGLSDLNKVIILHGNDMEFGILADAIIGTRTVPLAALQQSLPTLTEIRAEYLKGVTEERLVVLDGEKLLSDRRIIVHEDV